MRRTLLMIAAVALLLTQCRKPVVEYPTAEPTNDNMVSMTVTVGHGGKTDITAAGGITWSENDKLYVGDGSKYIGYLELQSGAGSATGTFSGSVSATAGSYTFGLYYLGSNPPEVASDATSVDIPFGTQTGLRENLSVCHIGYGTAKGKVEGTSVILDSTAPVTMKSKVAIAYFEFKKDDGDYIGAITLSGTNIYNSMTVGFGGTFTGKDKGGISLASTPSSQKYVMLVPPADVAEETLNFGGAYEGITKFYNGIEANKFYCLGAGEPIEVSVVKYVPKFTVDASGTKVEFSPGNLQYLGKSDGTGTWRFADHQWDYMGAGPTATSNRGNVDLSSLGYLAGEYNTGSGAAGGSETEADKAAARDLFGWGCTGYQDTRKDNHTNWYQTNYQPYSTSYTTAGGTINRYGYGPDYYDDSKYNLTVDNKSDWGCLKIGDDPANTWRTLTRVEWKCLLETRTTATGGLPNASSRYAKVTVDGVKGLLLFPDWFEWDATKMGTAPTKTNNTSAAYTTGSYTAAEFSEQEKSGVVFLPAAGYRGTNTPPKLTEVGSTGYYWSSTCGSYDAVTNALAFHSGNVAVGNTHIRHEWAAVRLVR